MTQTQTNDPQTTFASFDLPPETGFYRAGAAVIDGVPTIVILPQTAVITRGTGCISRLPEGESFPADTLSVKGQRRIVRAARRNREVVVNQNHDVKIGRRR